MTWNKKASAYTFDDMAFPLVVEVAKPTDVLAFVSENADDVKRAIQDHGAILLRGFGSSEEQTLSNILQVVWAKPISYTYRSTPRTSVSNGIYTATEYPANRDIPPHCECSYQRDWPMILGFHCVDPANEGGQTPLGDMSRITKRIGTDIVATFEERGVQYVRNYSDNFDLPWKEVFQTSVKSEVEAYCKDHGLSFEWKKEDQLRTSQTCQGMALHPTTGESIWFNQSNLFHVSSLGESAARSMLDVFGEENLPRHAFFGDGASIPSDVLEKVKEAFSSEMISFDWQRHDILLLDNMRVCHARRPYTGNRRVLASMGLTYSEAVRLADDPSSIKA